MPDKRDTRTVECIFWEPLERTASRVDIEAPTGLGPDLVALRHACQMHAKQHQLPAWVQPMTVEAATRWLGFTMQSGMAKYARDFPSLAAAEMWLIHRMAPRT